jgi:hypothetical protein
MAEKGTKIVLLAKNTKGGDSLRELLLEVVPKQIPIDFIYMINIIYNKDQIFEVPLNLFKEDINLNKVERIVEISKFKDEIDAIEIIVDLGKLKKFMNNTTQKLFANVFID